MKHLFIVNPKAGKGKALQLIPHIKNAFKYSNEEFIIEVTKGEGHATELVKRYVNKENYRVYAVGGDGTLNEVLNGIANTESCLGVIPSGSGNDFIKSIYKETLAENIIEDTIKGNTKIIDLAKVDDRYFLNISSVGIDAEVVDNAKVFKKYPFISGRAAYIFSAIVTIFTYKYRRIQLIIDDKEITLENTLTTFANGKYYGGGMKVAPDADLQDGLFDICTVDKLSRIKMFTLFPKLIKGTHRQIEEVCFYKAKKIIVSSKDEITVNIDGEIVKRKDVIFELIPKGINFIIPRS
ncbi:diacylglycerol/lipid kinase family protein [Clostridium thailandense]|uniref:diacylglycerol/lipid kinase family protein n=1 Tax=Clostridium thailandense TaxID=2794346 RepID=UPI003989689B